VGDINQWVATAQELLIQFGINLLVAIVIFVIGRWVAKVVTRFVKRLMARRGTDPTITDFTANILYYGLLTFVVIAALNRLGLQTASIIAVVGAAGLAIGLALQGSLSNFAAGVLLIIFRPFRVGDFIEGGGATGSVEEIQLFTTTLVTPQNTVVIVPNSKILDDNITNFTGKAQRRVETTVGISYDDDIERARQVMLEEIAKDGRILPDPAPRVSVSALADSSVNLDIWVWVNTPNFLAVKLDLPERIKARLDAENISIPFPQRDVHLFQPN
jgi:small conductance mechanosensitive channel